MIIDGQKWACEACIRGHRVTSCKHHDRPLIRIKRKGRPFATCSICNATPCSSPTEHARQKREAELKHPSKKATHARLYPRHHNPHGFLPIAPRPCASKAKESDSASASSSARVSRSGSASESAHSRTHTPRGSIAGHHPSTSSSLRRDSAVTGSWSGSESGNESRSRSGRTGSTGHAHSKGYSSGERSAPDNVALDGSGNLFDPLYSLLPASSVSQFAQTAPLISPLESGANPFDFPLDPALGIDAGALGYLDEMDVDVTEGLTEELFHVEDWSRYMWSPETGFEHLDMGYPPVTR